MTQEERALLGAILRALGAPQRQFTTIHGLIDKFDPLAVAELTKADIVLQAAKDEWDQGIDEDDEDGQKRISKYIWEGLGWSWIAPFEPADFEWCGAFAAWCCMKAGLKQDIRKKHLASTYRLFRWSDDNARRIEPKDIEPGDIVVVGRIDKKRHGSHVTICRSVGSYGIGTWEGNATAPGSDATPEGKGIYEGVITRSRPFNGEQERREYCVLYGVRPMPSDYE